MPALDRFKSAMRPLFVATVIGAGSLAAISPATAQSFNFQLNVPGQGGGGVQFGFGTGNQGGGQWNRPGVRCLTDREIRQQISANGYYDVQVAGDLGRNRALVYASNGPWEYSMRVNRCTGEVDRFRREGRASGGGGNWGGGGGNWGGGGGGNWGGGGGGNWGGGNWR